MHQRIAHLLTTTLFIGLAACGSSENAATIGAGDTNLIEPGPDAGASNNFAEDTNSSDAGLGADAHAPCPYDAPVLCDDGSCAQNQASCASDTSLLEGHVLALSPGTIFADAPEALELTLHIEDPEHLNRLLMDGARLSIELKSARGVEHIPIASMDSLEHTYNMSFTPEAQSSGGPARAVVSVVLKDAEGAHLASFKGARLRYRGDVDGLEFDRRQGEVLQGIVDPRRAWALDLDGDGIEDRVVFDGAVDFGRSEPSPGLRLYRCDSLADEACTPMGVAAITPSSYSVANTGATLLPITSDQIIAPDMLHGDVSAGFLFAYISERTEAGDAARVIVKQIEFAREESTEPLITRQANILLPSRGGQSWPGHLITPHLYPDPARGSDLLGVVALGYAGGEESQQWSVLLLDAEGNQGEYDSPLSDLNLDPKDAGTFIASCFPAGSVSSPHGLTIAAYPGADNTSVLAIAALVSPRGTVQYFDLPALEEASPRAQISCRLKDLDGDGIDDLIIALPEGDDGARLYAMRGLEAGEGLGAPTALAAPQLLIVAAHRADWEIFRHDEHVYLRAAHRSNEGFAPPMHLVLTAEEGDERGFAFALVDQQAAPGGTPLISFAIPDAPAAFLHGNDKVVRKKPGRIANASIVPGGGNAASDTAGQHLIDSRQIATSEGVWIAARFEGGFKEAHEGAALLASLPPQNLFGLISRSGEYLPVDPASIDNGKVGEPTGLVLKPCSEGHCDPFVMMISRDGEALQILEATVYDDAPKLLNQRRVGLDFSGVSHGSAHEISQIFAGSQSYGDEVLIALVLKDGRVLAGSLETSSVGNEEEALVLEDTGLDSHLLEVLRIQNPAVLSPVATSLWTGSLGAEPIIALQGGKTTLLWSKTRGIKALEGTFVFGDVLGLSSTQLIQIEEREEAFGACEQGRLVTITPAHMKGEVETWDDLDASFAHSSDPICLPEGNVSVIDIDADGCADLLSTQGQVVLSRCDGDFELAMYSSASWRDHLEGGDGWTPTTRGQGYNSSRSNKANSLWVHDPFDEEDDSEDPVPALPFFDALESRSW